VFTWLDGIELIDEQRERTFNTKVDDDALPHWLDL
jgi:uncharacterized protein YndB with AHSA1/START domain